MGWSVVDEWVQDRTEESLHLDFKRAAADGQPFHKDDETNLSKELSGFANTEGGVIVFGIETTRDRATKVDRVEGARSIKNLQLFEEAVRSRLVNATTPPIAGVMVTRVENRKEPGTGIVAIFVPQSDGGPHRASGASKDVNDRYFMRIATGTVTMPHPLLAAMFGVRPPPKLHLSLYRIQDGFNRLRLTVKNVGRGSATGLLIRFRLNRGENIFWNHAACAETGWSSYGIPAPDKEVRFSKTGILYANDESDVGWVRPQRDELPERLTIDGRIDAEGAQPVEFSGELPLDDTPVCLPELR